MEQRVSLREVNQHLARYVKAVESGERIVITRRGKPIALLSPIPRQERALSAAQEAALERLLSQPRQQLTSRKAPGWWESPFSPSARWPARFPSRAAGCHQA